MHYDMVNPTMKTGFKFYVIQTAEHKSYIKNYFAFIDTENVVISEQMFNLGTLHDGSVI